MPFKRVSLLHFRRSPIFCHSTFACCHVYDDAISGSLLSRGPIVCAEMAAGLWETCVGRTICAAPGGHYYAIKLFEAWWVARFLRTSRNNQWKNVKSFIFWGPLRLKGQHKIVKSYYVGMVLRYYFSSSVGGWTLVEAKQRRETNSFFWKFERFWLYIPYHACFEP